MAKNILLMVTGMTPQIITETVYGLAVRPAAGVSAWLPDEIQVISTQDGLTQIRDRLFDKGHFQRLIDDYQLPAIHFDESCLYPIVDAHQQPLADLKTPADNENAANLICQRVRQLTQDPEVQLHVSIAGGRKTMGFYAGYALSLYGRAQDRMSHVLVEDRFENAPDFYYPTPVSRFVTDRNGKSWDASEAQVWLASIAFVRLRSYVPEQSLLTDAQFSEVVESINAASQPLQLTLNELDKTVSVGTKTCHLAPREFAFYLWFARRKQRGEPGIERPIDGIPFDGEEYQKLYNSLGKQQDIEFDQKFFDQTRSRLKKKFLACFGADLTARIHITQPGRNRPYACPLAAGQIVIDEM